jgi:hypothetical protein
VLERERDVVERVEEDEALVRREEARVRVGREGGRPGGDLAAAIVGHAAIDAAKREARDIHEERTRRRERDVALELPVERALVLDHLRVEKASVLMADLLGRAGEAHLEDLASVTGIGGAEDAQIGIVRRDGGLAEGDGEGRGLDPGGGADHAVGDQGPDQEESCGDELRAVTRGETVGRGPNHCATHQPAPAPAKAPPVSASVFTTRTTMRAGSRTLSKWVTRCPSGG